MHQLLWFMYRVVFTVGVVVTNRSSLSLAGALTDYSYVKAREGDSNGAQLARCLTGLGPSGNNNNALGGLYFNGNMILSSDEQGPCSSNVIQVRPGGSIAGVINIHRCQAFSTAVEGIYTCTMMSSSVMNQSVRFGIYFTVRSKSFDLYIPSLNHLSSLYTAAPVIDTPLSSTVTVNIHSSLTLNCTSRGSPPDTFTWRKDNKQSVLGPSNITEVTYNAATAVFRAYYSINNVTTSDSGTYTCTVTNPIGSYSVTITVDVIGKLI